MTSGWHWQLYTLVWRMKRDWCQYDKAILDLLRESFWAYPNPFPLEASEQIISGFPMLFGCSSKYFETERFSLNLSLTLSLASRNCVMELHSSLRKDFAVLWRILTWLKYFLTKFIAKNETFSFRQICIVFKVYKSASGSQHSVA